MTERRSKPAILFWFYRDPVVVADRLAFVRQVNPAAQVFGLYGGPPADLESFSLSMRLLDDVWVHPPVDGEWAWNNGDLMIARWYAERGWQLAWEQVLVHQWDLLTTVPASDLATSGPLEILLTGVRPLAEVASHWVWVQPWSTRYPAWQAFTRHPLVRDRPAWASIFVLATFTRTFLDDYAAVAFDVPGFVEYRLPTVAAALGYRFAATDLRPDWGDQGDPLLNGCGRAVTAEQIRERLSGIPGVKALHPVYGPAPDLTVLSSPPPAVPMVAVLQVPPARPGVAPGGSQVVAAAIADGLARDGIRVALLSGASGGAAREAGLVTAGGVTYLPAFPITAAVLADGEPDIEFLPQAAAVLGRCSVAFMFDRIYPLPPRCLRVLVLGTTAYPFARTAVLSDGWHRMIVPSDYVRDHVVEVLHAAGRGERAAYVFTVHNPVDGSRIGLPERSPARPEQRTGPTRLLFPHRFDCGKGLEHCLRLLAKLNDHRDTVLRVVADHSPTADPALYPAVMAAAHSLGVVGRLEFFPWRPMRQMAELYTSADLTLCLGDVPEGFGLVCLESILCGTPVLARAVGAQTRLLPPSHGCVAAPADAADLLAADAALVKRTLDDPLLSEQIARGQEEIRRRFTLASFLAAVQEVAGLPAWSADVSPVTGV